MKLATASDPSSWQLTRSSGYLALQAPSEEGSYQVSIQVTEGPMARRVRTARRTDPLPRAVGMHRRRIEHVVDATAGLGRDSLVLAHLGCTVTAIERVPALCVMLQVAVEESEADIEVIRAEAIPWLRDRSGSPAAPDVVYLDPMFSEAGKAQVKKEMQACRILAGTPHDAAELLAAARAAARDRVVVKRHPHHKPLADDVSFEVGGDRVRFDVYLAS